MTNRNTTHHRWISLALCACLAWAPLGAAQDDDQDPLKGETVAPPNMRSLGGTLGGAFFVDQQLLERYEALKAQLVKVREDISLGKVSGEAALKSLEAIERESKRLRAELEDKKVIVAPFRVFAKTSEQTFPLGDERLVIVTGDNVTVRGWDGPGLKCVVEKIIVAKQQPEDSQFDSVQVQHELKVADDLVGLTRQQRDQQEQEFLASEEGRKLTDEQRSKRKEFVDQIHHSYDDYLAFQGRQVNTIQLTGLSYQDGNRNLTIRINSPQGGGTVSSQWQRHATMTVYVPPCKSLAVRGCLVGLDIQDVDCDLVLTTHGSKDRQYDGTFVVRGVAGNVTIDQAPVRELSNVTGDVRFTATNEFVNSGTHHSDSLRTYSPYATQSTRIYDIGGDLQAEFLRTDLQLSGILGVLDVVNQHGATDLRWDAVDTNRAHRVMSSSGKISVHGPAAVLERTPIYAHTECGRLHTNMTRDILDDVSFSTGRPRRGWHGFVTPSKDRFSFAKLERPAAALENRQRDAGLDLISHAGTVSIVTEP